jgi:hypothetical protein
VITDVGTGVCKIDGNGNQMGNVLSTGLATSITLAAGKSYLLFFDNSTTTPAWRIAAQY